MKCPYAIQDRENCSIQPIERTARPCAEIVSTGLLSYLFLGRSLTRLRWCALFLVTVGAITSQLAADGDTGNITTFTARPRTPSFLKLNYTRL